MRVSVEGTSSENRVFVHNLVTNSTKPSRKANDFFIIHQSRGINGATLPDEEFATQLQEVLKKEKMVSGRNPTVVRAYENEDGILQMFQQMSASIVVLVILSEDAIRTFAGDLQEQNTYLLLIQFALRLYDNCGVRVLGLNLVTCEDYEDVHAFIKFQGWTVRFNDIPHPSPWIQDSIAKSMKRLFAIQGISIDLDDWQFKVPTLFGSLYAAKDDLNATSWGSIIKIIPWKSIWGLLATFTYCFFFPVLGFFVSLLYSRFSKGSKRHKRAHFNTSLFGTGLSLVFIAVILTGITVFDLSQGALCSSDLKCETMVRAGDRWAKWCEVAINCNDDCYENQIMHWSQNFSFKCAKCVCQKIRIVSDEQQFIGDQEDCTNSKAQSWAAITIVVVVAAIVSLTVSIKRLNKQALIATEGLSLKQLTQRKSKRKLISSFTMRIRANSHKKSES
jgi:hypothetical protein